MFEVLGVRVSVFKAFPFVLVDSKSRSIGSDGAFVCFVEPLLASSLCQFATSLSDPDVE